MVKVITYGTFDLLHFGHIRLLERAKALGDYLIVGVTADDFDKKRGKINVVQSLMERIEGVRATGIADEIIVEEYDGQKIDDILRYGVDIFTVGSDWIGKFDYLKEYCKVVYLERTEGVSSSIIRSEKRKLRIKIIGNAVIGEKFVKESKLVNGVEIVESDEDALYIVSPPEFHYSQIKQALEQGKHVICESPVAETKEQCSELFRLAEERQCVLMEGIKTAYSTAYSRLLLLAKSGEVGNIVSVDATCTSMRDQLSNDNIDNYWNSIEAWGPTALLPVFQLLGTDYLHKTIVSHYIDREKNFDGFTKIDFLYPCAVASIKVAKAAKSEGELVITGTKGYFYVPAPWWKTDYFEIRYENQEKNKRYFFQLDGEGIRYQIVAFAKAVELGISRSYIDKTVSIAIAGIMEEFFNHNVYEILLSKEGTEK